MKDKLTLRHVKTIQHLNSQCVVLFTLVFLFIAGCKTKQATIVANDDIILSEKDLIPEGLAFDKRTGIIYIGSTYKRKIIQIDSAGNVSDFITSKSAGIWSPVGMEVDEDRDILWVNTAHANEVMPLMDPDTTKDWMTGIVAYNISQKKLIKKYVLDKPKAFFNDLTVTQNGNVYITESVNNGIYRISTDKDKPELFLEPQGYSFLNGIAYCDSLNILFVASAQGVLKVDINSKNYMLLKTEDSIDAGRIDGLAYYHNYLIGHQSFRVSKFFLNDEMTSISKVKILDSGKEFDGSTTGEIGIGSYYFIVNSQISSGVDYKNRAIKPIDSLENIIVRKVKLQ